MTGNILMGAQVVNRAGFDGGPPQSANTPPMWLTSAMRASRFGQVMRMADLGDISYLMYMLQEIITKDAKLYGLMQVRVSGLENLGEVRCFANDMDNSVSPSTREEISQFGNSIIDNMLLVRRQNGALAADGGSVAINRKVSFKSSWFGFFPGWAYWNKTGIGVVPVGIEELDNRTFKVAADDSLMLLTPDSPQQGKPFHEFGSFNAIEVRHNGINSKLSDCGIGRPCSYSWFLAFSTYVLLLRYTEMTATPSPILERAGIDGVTTGYSPGSDAEALSFLKNYMAGIVSLMPAGFKLNWQEPGKGGHVLFDFIDKMVSDQYKHLILGQPGTTSEKSHLGGQQDTGMEIQEFVTMGEASKVCWFWNTIIERAVRLNYGRNVRPPSVRIVKENLAKRLQMVELLDKAKKLGVPVSERYALELTGFPRPRKGERLLGGERYDPNAQPAKPQLEAKPEGQPENKQSEGENGQS